MATTAGEPVFLDTSLCNLVAVMLRHGARRIATRNPSDFVRFKAEVDIEPISP